jgi:hypothetical protein
MAEAITRPTPRPRIVSPIATGFSMVPPSSTYCAMTGARLR